MGGVEAERCREEGHEHERAREDDPGERPRVVRCAEALDKRAEVAQEKEEPEADEGDHQLQRVVVCGEEAIYFADRVELGQGAEDDHHRSP
jgi:hypothetical protein